MSLLLPDCAGPCLRSIHPRATWARDGSGTLPRPWATEFEAVLQFLDSHGQFERRMSRLTDDRRALFAVLAEGRTGRFLVGLGFRILAWEPPSPTGLGDLLVQWGNATPVFVEVKAPDKEGEWAKELSLDELLARKALGRLAPPESGAVSPVEMPFQVIRDKVLKKLTADQPNLAVIVDDLRASPADARGVIEGSVARFFGSPDVKRLGGVLFLKPETVWGRPVYYLSNFYHNPNALTACCLPEQVIDTLTASAERDAAMIA